MKVKMKPRAIVIADDLNRRLRQRPCICEGRALGFRQVSAIETWSEAPADVIALSTETRNIGAEEAQDRLLLLGDLSRFSISLYSRRSTQPAGAILAQRC
jgi:hypothetical protein